MCVCVCGGGGGWGGTGMGVVGIVGVRGSLDRSEVFIWDQNFLK